jgi:hypothetical protein
MQSLTTMIPVKDKQGAGWKWRNLAPSGKVVESERTFRLYYDCVVAAREHGYEFKTVCR